ncbi:DUF2878 domain-containing protein [Parashewanella curva]|uniref:DUF2878 domain-containing protein n=1 Tax=Parashewanella curva TaxID=2338552 RepID=A0A3L8PZ23_9GAMM|nr:DUF2878 domain-containing protein [Parashewanella curva]RLV59768.1 DUF2878 domain-containing protein [Parashewanella curva]
MLYNLVIFSILWLACVLFGNMAVPFVVLFSVLYFLKYKSISDLNLILFIVALGGLADTILMHFDIIEYRYHNEFQHNSSVAPLWMWAIWLSFAISVKPFLQWLAQSVWVQLLFAVTAPASAYFIAQQLGAMKFTLPNSEIFMLLGMISAVLIPLFTAIQKWTDEDKVPTHKPMLIKN